MVIWIHRWIKACSDCVCVLQMLIWICMLWGTISVVSIYFVWVCVFTVCVFLCVWDIVKDAPWTATLLWKRIVGILYLSMPPFGPWNARAYFPIMALSCSRLPWETRCSPRSAVLAPPCFIEVWRGRWRGKKGESVCCTVLWWVNADEGQLLCRAYYSLSALGGLSVAAAAIH